MAQRYAFDVLGVGTATIDDFIHVRRYPPADEKEMILREDRRFGGLIGTALATAARLGRKCAYLGTLGTDASSLALVGGLEDAGIDCSYAIRVPEVQPIHSLIVVDEVAHTRNIFYTDPTTLMPPEDQIDEQIVARARILIVDQLGIAAARHVRGLGIPVVADMDWTGRDDEKAFMSLADHLILSAGFAEEITGRKDSVDAVEVLHGKEGRNCTAVTCGAGGCYYLAGPNGKRVEHVPALQIREVETTGCGDVFHGAYASALSQENDIEKCLMYATAAASLYASRPSGWEHLPTSREVDELIGRFM